MSIDFEQRLRAELGSEQIQVPLDTDRVLEQGRRSVRSRRVGGVVGGLAVLAALAAVVSPWVTGRTLPAVPAPAASPSVAATPATGGGVTWQVTKLGGKDLGDDSGLTMVVDGDHVRGSTVCVDYTADLTRNGEAWSVSNRADVAGTAIPCPSTASEQMNRYFDLLERATRAEVGVGTLALTGPKGTIEFAIKA